MRPGMLATESQRISYSPPSGEARQWEPNRLIEVVIIKRSNRMANSIPVFFHLLKCKFDCISAPIFCQHSSIPFIELAVSAHEYLFFRRHEFPENDPIGNDCAINIRKMAGYI